MPKYPMDNYQWSIIKATFLDLAVCSSLIFILGLNFIFLCFGVWLLPPRGFRPEGEIPRRHSSNSRVHFKESTAEIYSHTVNIEKISICLNRGCEESVGNDDVSIVWAHKYEMVRMT